MEILQSRNLISTIAKGTSWHLCDNIFHYNLPYEQQESIERLLGVTRFPTFMLFDKNGKLVSSDAPFPQHIDALINEINKCLE